MRSHMHTRTGDETPKEWGYLLRIIKTIIIIVIKSERVNCAQFGSSFLLCFVSFCSFSFLADDPFPFAWLRDAFIVIAQIVGRWYDFSRITSSLFKFIYLLFFCVFRFFRSFCWTGVCGSRFWNESSVNTVAANMAEHSEEDFAAGKAFGTRNLISNNSLLCQFINRPSQVYDTFILPFLYCKSPCRLWRELSQRW